MTAGGSARGAERVMGWHGPARAKSDNRRTAYGWVKDQNQVERVGPNSGLVADEKGQRLYPGDWEVAGLSGGARLIITKPKARSKRADA